MYQPEEDSYLLLNILNKYVKKSMKVLEIGAGSGIISEKAKQLGADVLAVDIDSQAIAQLKKKAINAKQSDLFSNIKGRFDLIIFNPPYLPEHKYDKQKDTTGGKKGDETIINFLLEAKNYLNKNGKILLLLSSLTPRERINKIIRKIWQKKKIKEDKLFFEKLEIWEIKRIS